MSIRESLVELEQDVTRVRLKPPHEVRARGDALRRRQVGTAVGAGVVLAAVTGAVALPLSPRTASPADQPDVGVSIECVASPHPLPIKGSPPAENIFSRRATVYLKADSSADEIAAVVAELQSMPGIDDFGFTDREHAYEAFKEAYCDNPELVGLTNPDSLPESFTVWITRFSEFPGFEEQMLRLPAVDTVVQLPE